MTYFCICNAIKGQEWTDAVQEVGGSSPEQAPTAAIGRALRKLDWRRGCGMCIARLKKERREQRAPQNALVC